jgi:hypothetical protein
MPPSDYRASMEAYTKEAPHATPEEDRCLKRRVWHDMERNLKPLTYLSTGSCFLSPLKFYLRRSAIKNVPPATPASPAPTAIAGPIDRITSLSRELRDTINANVLPDEILVRNGVIDPRVRRVSNLFVNRQFYKECRDLIQKDRVYKLEYTSITKLIRSLDNMPTGGLAPFKRVIITTTGPYNGHAASRHERGSTVATFARSYTSTTATAGSRSRSLAPVAETTDSTDRNCDTPYSLLFGKSSVLLDQSLRPIFSEAYQAGR